MRLSKIKLSGFKSFVDPTTMSLPSNLMGIVGPNGCGKSNIIDAIRWVMGESSARHLRGESMADVIFSGSTARKPVGKATIELVFDNSDGTIGGQYAEYNEIAVKRQVTRDGQSQYFLNNAKCRRRDITDIFLGTGLGPRSYAIIEQGMISRIIEAKPEELRTFIEEAAGVSKYKERRRETENRIRHTQDNLSRLNDLRDELEKQIARLQRQAKTAEKYKILKQDEKQLKGQLLALRWKGLKERSRHDEQVIIEQENNVEASVATQRQIEADIEKLRDERTEATDHFNQVQADFYSVGADVARTEQTIKHSRERQEQITHDLKRGEQALHQLREHADTDKGQLQILLDDLSQAEPELEKVRALEISTREQQSAAEQVMTDWQNQWEQFSREATVPAREAEAERASIRHLESQAGQAHNREKRLVDEQQSLNPEPLDEQINTLEKTLSELDKQRSEVEAKGKQLTETLQQQRNNIIQISNDMQSQGEQLQKDRGRLSSLEALQQQALGKNQGEVSAWLEKNSLAEFPRLAQQLAVKSGWEMAVEKILGHHLEAICVDDFPDNIASFKHPKGRVGIYDMTGPVNHKNKQSDFTPLSDYISAPANIAALVGSVYAVETLNEALSSRSKLLNGESFITKDGIWVGVNWIRLSPENEENSGILEREQELKTLNKSVKELEQIVADLRDRQEQGRAIVKEQEVEDTRLRSEYSGLQRQHAEAQSKMGGLKARQEQMRQRLSVIVKEVNELKELRTEHESKTAEARQRLEQAVESMQRVEEQREVLTVQREKYRTALERARDASRKARDAGHQTALRVETMRTRSESLKEGMQRSNSQTGDLSQRVEELTIQLEETQQPLINMAAELNTLLTKRSTAEQSLKTAREALEVLEQTVRKNEQSRHQAEETVQKQRSKLEQLRMEMQEVVVRLQTVVEQIDEAGFEIQALMDSLPDEANESDWQEQVEQMERRISRLGPINLAAIEEYEQQSERKEYLDAQHEDLIEALTTLQNAIRKIDKETRTRFKETFDQINKGIKDLFPRLFGGGHAYLELTSDDLLETGVTVMARPPGKRNSSIQLLSGGEKALTAVSLVFSIFLLNPAPFCLLDEVDAPLDEANVGRFVEMVRSMSDRVQFMFITHNKVTMELSQHLIGVTMHEAGCSRLVSVDVEEAVELARA